MRYESKKIRKLKSNHDELWTKSVYEEYTKELHNIEYMAGFTENVVPYGMSIESENDNYNH